MGFWISIGIMLAATLGVVAVSVALVYKDKTCLTKKHKYRKINAPYLNQAYSRAAYCQVCGKVDAITIYGHRVCIKGKIRTDDELRARFGLKNGKPNLRVIK